MQKNKRLAAAVLAVLALRLGLPPRVNLTRCFRSESLRPRDPNRSRRLAQAALTGAEPLGHQVVTTRATVTFDE